VSTPKNPDSEGSVFGPIGSLFGAVLGPMTWENISGWVKIIGLILLIRWVWFEPFRIPSGSMEPTLHGDPRFFHGDRVAVNKWIYGPRIPFMNKRIFNFKDPQRFDIVVFRAVEEGADNKILIKRLMGLPGERIHIKDDKVHVNGEAVKMPADLDYVKYTEGPGRENRKDLELKYGKEYIAGVYSDYKYGLLHDDEYAVVPEDHYLFLGDNSADSKDGRVFGWVPRDNIVGPAFCVWWPFGNARDFTGFSHTWWGMLILYGIPGGLVVYEVSRSFFIASWRLRTHIVPGDLREGDRILINRLAFGFRVPFTEKRLTPGRRPIRGEMVAYHAPDDCAFPHAVLVGQVVGFSGDKVRIKNNSIEIDGDNIGESNPSLPATSEVPVTSRPRWVTQKEPKVPNRHYIIIADGGDETVDSRIVGMIPHDNMIGVARSVWWPLSRRRSLADLTGNTPH